VRAFVEKLQIGREESFYCQVHRTPAFEVPWHQHEAVELLLVLEGSGISYVGNYVGSFAAGNVFLVGSNLAHTFQKQKDSDCVAALVIQFLPNCWGEGFLALPESRSVRLLLDQSLQGIQLNQQFAAEIAVELELLQKETGMKRLLSLTAILHRIATEQDFVSLSNLPAEKVSHRHQERIDAVFQYSQEHFSEKITLSSVAGLANMTVPAFCQYFKKRTRKTYIDFLTEIRIGNACQQLRETNETILSIAFGCGYSSLANFNKQFLKLKKETPRSYRKKMKLAMKNQLETDLSIRMLE